MKRLSKILSAGLSLTLCAGLVAPSFAAASFADLKDAINGKSDTTENQITTEDGSTRYGYGTRNEETDKYEIEAWNDGGTRCVTLNENVTYQGSGDVAGIITKANSNVTLNLNGNTIDGGYDAKTGKGGSGQSIIKMGNNSTLTVNGGADSTDTSKRGTITGGRSNGYAGAIDARIIRTLTINNVEFIGNSAKGGGGAITTYSSEVTLNNTIMTSNSTDKRGGALWAGSQANVTMTGDTVIISNEGYQGVDDIFQYEGVLAPPHATITGLPDTVKHNGVTYTKSTVTVHDTDFEDEKGGVDNYTGTKIYYVVHDECKFADKVTTEPTCTKPGEKESQCICGLTTTEEIPALGHDMHDEDWVVTTLAGPGVAGEETRVCRREGCDYTETRSIPALPVPAPAPVTDPTTEIDDVDVPLSGIFTRADAIGYLWQQAGSPEWELSDFADVPEDHEWAVAIGWAQDMGIAVADVDGNFRPDDLVLRSTEDVEGEFQEFLNRYAVYAGIELDEDELFIKLEGAADDVIMGEEAQKIFDSFFAKLNAAPTQAV